MFSLAVSSGPVLKADNASVVAFCMGCRCRQTGSTRLYASWGTPAWKTGGHLTHHLATSLRALKAGERIMRETFGWELLCLGGWAATWKPS